MSMFNKSFSDIESHTYENWGSISGSGMSGSVENSLSRSPRCFQVDSAGETNSNQNYYSTTRNLTPGPGTYELNRSDPQVAPYAPTFSFGNSVKQRTLSESNRLWAPSDNSTPSPNAYNINKSTTEDCLKNLLGVSKWKLKNLQRKFKNVKDMSKFEKRTTGEEIKLLEKRIKAINRELKLIPPPVSPIKKNKNPFVMTDLKPHQKPVKIQEAPTFYMNEEMDWDFGSKNRGLNVPDMGSFGYSKSFIENKEREEQNQANVITGSSSAKSKCRNTDFFGPNKGVRNEVPPAGTYTPELVPTNYLYGMSGTIKSGGYDDATLSTHSSWKTGYSFNFSRAASLKKPLSASLPSHMPHSRGANSNMRTRSRNKSRSRRNSNCSELTLETLPAPTKSGRASTSEGTTPSRVFSPISK